MDFHVFVNNVSTTNYHEIKIYHFFPSVLISHLSIQKCIFFSDSEIFENASTFFFTSEIFPPHYYLLIIIHIQRNENQNVD